MSFQDRPNPEEYATDEFLADLAAMQEADVAPPKFHILEVVTTFVMPLLKFLISPFIKLVRWTGDVPDMSKEEFSDAFDSMVKPLETERLKELQSMRVDCLDIEELKLIIAHREKESRVVKEGFLKEDLYTFDSSKGYSGIHYHINMGDEYFTSEQVDDVVNDFKSHFKLALEKGTRFVAFWYYDSLMWYDDVGYGIEEMEDDWAEKYLEPIFGKH